MLTNSKRNITQHKTIRHLNRKCHLINSNRLRFLPPAPVAHNAARLPTCNTSQSYRVSHQSHTVCIPDSFLLTKNKRRVKCAVSKHGMLKNGGQKPWTEFIGTPTCIHFFGSLPVPRAKVAKSTASEFVEFYGISVDQEARKHTKRNHVLQ